MKVFGAEVARWIRSAAARGEEADLVSARKGFWCQHSLYYIILLGQVPPKHSELSFAPSRGCGMFCC